MLKFYILKWNFFLAKYSVITLCLDDCNVEMLFAHICNLKTFTVEQMCQESNNF